MRNMFYTLGAVLLSGLFAQGAAASAITVQVTGHVVEWGDSYGVFGGKMNLGQTITGTYTYDTDTLESGLGYYRPSSPPANVTVSAGAFTFQSAPTSGFEISIQQGAGPNSPGGVQIYSFNNQPLPTGQAVEQIQFLFTDPSGQWPTSVALPTGAPTLQNLSASQVNIYGEYFNVVAVIDSVTLLPPALEVSPASGNFVPGQHFDIALLLPAGVTVASVRSIVNGSQLPQVLYPGQACAPGPQNASRTVIICNSGDQLLAVLGGSAGVTQVDWQVTLGDGTVVNQNVTWNLLR
jgi:hypothetical protein